MALYCLLLNSYDYGDTCSPNRETQATLFRSCVQNASVKIFEANPAGYTRRKASQRSSKYQMAWLHLRPCLVPRLGVRQQS